MWKKFKKDKEEEIVLKFQDEEVTNGNSEENGVHHKVKRVGQKAVTTKWIIIKMKGGRSFKARLVAGDIEEGEEEMLVIHQFVWEKYWKLF